jgi:hypothetical protein
MEDADGILWDSVGCGPWRSSLRVWLEANCCGFNRIHVSNTIRLPGTRFALYSATYKIGFPGWPEPILDSVTGFGASITKRGLAPAPFFISRPIYPSFSLKPAPTSILLCANSGFVGNGCLRCAKKMSGRWGERPLGRGDGGYCNPELVRFFWPFRCAREQQDDTQEQTGYNRSVTPEKPNHSRLLGQFASDGIFRR